MVLFILGTMSETGDSSCPDSSETFERLCRDLVPAQRVFEHEDMKYGGEKVYEIRPESDSDQQAAARVCNLYNLAEIQKLLTDGNTLLYAKGATLREYRSGIRTLTRSLLHRALAIGACFSEHCGCQIERAKSYERTVQVEPARIFRTLQILDIAERMLKEQRGDWLTGKP